MFMANNGRHRRAGPSRDDPISALCFSKKAWVVDKRHKKLSPYTNTNIHTATIDRCKHSRTDTSGIYVRINVDIRRLLHLLFYINGIIWGRHILCIKKSSTGIGVLGRKPVSWPSASWGQTVTTAEDSEKVTLPKASKQLRKDQRAIADPRYRGVKVTSTRVAREVSDRSDNERGPRTRIRG